jgi:hypothetical protein
VARGLAKARDERWPSMRELRAALESWLWQRGCDTDVTGRRLSPSDMTWPHPLPWLPGETLPQLGIPPQLAAQTVLAAPALAAARAAGVEMLAEATVPRPRGGWLRSGTWTLAAIACALPLWLLVPAAPNVSIRAATTVVVRPAPELLVAPLPLEPPLAAGDFEADVAKPPATAVAPSSAPTSERPSRPERAGSGAARNIYVGGSHGLRLPLPTDPRF